MEPTTPALIKACFNCANSRDSLDNRRPQCFKNPDSPEPLFWAALKAGPEFACFQERKK